MAQDKNSVYINLGTTSGATLDLSTYIGSSTNWVEISGSKTLDQNFAITMTGVLKGTYLVIYYRGVVTPGAFTFTVLGRVIPTLLLGKRFIAQMEGSGTSTPQCFVIPDFSENVFIGGGGIGGGEIEDSHIASDAAIGLSKLAALTADHVPIIGSTGFLEASLLTAVKLGYLASITSDLQTQIDSKVTVGAASLANADIAPTAAIAFSKLAALTASRVAVTDSSGVLTPASVTAIELGYLVGVTSGIQAQLNAKLGQTLAQGSILIGNSSNIATATDIKTSGRILVGTGVTSALVAISGDATLASSGALTIANDAVTPAKVSAEMRKEVIVTPVSWESAYTGNTFKIRLPYACSITHIHVSVTKAIAGTSDAYITLFNHSGTAVAGASLVSGALTIPMSSAAGTVVQSTCTGNNTFTAAQTLQLKVDKADVGGNAVVSIEFTRS